jgi:hypothetical protein
METTASPFLIFFREAPDMYRGMTQEDKDELSAQWNAWYEGLEAQGKVQHGHPLLPESRIVSGPRGERVVDGPFAEAKEAIGGYFLLTVKDFDEATEVAQRCPSLRLGMTVEVRPVAHSCPALNVKGRAAKPQPATV